MRWVLIGLLGFSVGVVAPAANTARAEMVATAAALRAVEAGDATSSARERVATFLGRADVVDQLKALGVDPDEATRRVASLSDAEISTIDARLADLPAGGSFAGTVLAVLLVVILVVLITDLLGITDVFTFVNPLPRGSARSR